MKFKEKTITCFIYVEKGILALASAEKGSELEKHFDEYFKEHPQILFKKFEIDRIEKTLERN